jgi:ATP-dependent protease ClpP protease subunit
MKIQQLLKDNHSRAKSPVNFVRNGTDATVYVYDVISSDWGVSAMSIIQAIAQAGDADTLTVRLNSPGGDVFESKAIIAAIQSFKGKSVAIIDGLCASAATSIAIACNEVEMAEGSLFMIHNASGMAYGDKTDLRKTADLLEKVESTIIDGYVKKTGMSAEDISKMMDAETWMTAAEALTNGFVDRIGPAKTVDNGWDLSAFQNAPKQEKPAQTAQTVKPETITQEHREFLNRKLRLSEFADSQ